MEAVEDAAGRAFLGHEADAVALGRRRTIDEVELGAPVMAAPARHRAPAENGIDEVFVGQRRAVSLVARRIVERALAAELHVPDALLRGEIAKGAGDRNVETFA